MNNSRMWLVMKPTVGIPLFLGGVAVGSFAVHVAVLSNTGWVSDFLSGQELGTTAAAASSAVQPASLEFDENGKIIKTSVDLDQLENGDGFTFKMPDGRTAKVVFD